MKSMNSPVRLSIIVPSHRAKNLVELCDSLVCQNCDFEYEVLIIANPPNARIRSQLERYGRPFQYFSLKEIGANRARNVGLNAAKGEYSFFLDDDCVLQSADFLRRLLDYLQNHPHSLVGGLYTLDESSRRLDKVYNVIQTTWLYSGAGTEKDNSRYLLGGNFAGSTVLLKEHLFDERLIFGGTETELFLRLQKLGVALHLNENLLVRHSTRLSYRGLLKKAYLQGRGNAYAESKGYPNKAKYFNYAAIRGQLNVKQNVLESFYFESYRSFFLIGQGLFSKDRRFFPWGLFLLLKIKGWELFVIVRRKMELYERLLSFYLKK